MAASIARSALRRINFHSGWPSPSLHPSAALAAAASNVLLRGHPSDELLVYGHELGHLSTREHLAAWLTSFYRPAAGAVTSDRIAVTNGASNALSTLLQKFADHTYTRHVWLVEPTYFLACAIFADHGFGDHLRGVPEDDEGIDLTFLARALAEADATAGPTDARSASKASPQVYPKLYRHLIYLVPTLANPSGKTMSLHHRTELVKLARRHDALLITDDVYDFLRWPVDEHAAVDKMPAVPPRLVDIDRELPGTSEYGNAVSNGSFSKIIAPAVRVGWCEATPSFTTAHGTVGATISGGCQGRMSSLFVEDMVASGIVDHHIKHVLVPTYRQRYYAMRHAVEKHLYPLGIRISTGTTYRDSSDPKLDAADFTGGFFFYLDFPRDGSLPPADEVARVAEKDYALLVAPGPIFAVSGDDSSAERAKTSFGNSIRLCWAFLDEELLLEGVERIATVIGDLLAEK